MALTKEQIKILNSLSVEDLRKLTSEKATASLQPLIDKYNETDKELTKIRKEINDVNPEWRPATFKETVFAFVKFNDGATVKEIKDEIAGLPMAKFLTGNLKKWIDAKEMTVDKDGNYSVVETEE